MAALGIATLAPGLDRLASSGSATAPVSSGLAIPRGPDGQFYLDGQAGRKTVRFLVDPAAPVTIIAGIDAARLGLADEGEVELPALAIGPVTQSGIRARIDPDLPVSLIGSDALARFAGPGAILPD